MVLFNGGSAMRKKISMVLYILLALSILILNAYSHTLKPENAYLSAVNDACKTNYGCELCHIDPKGGGSLSFHGLGFSDSGHDPYYFCSSADS